MAYIKKRFNNGRDYPNAARFITKIAFGDGIRKYIELGVWQDPEDFAQYPNNSIHQEFPIVDVDSQDHATILQALIDTYPEIYGNTPGNFISGNPEDESIDTSVVVE